MACGGRSPVLVYDETTPLINENDITNGQVIVKNTDAELVSEYDAVTEENENPDPQSSERVEPSQAEDARIERLGEIRRRRVRKRAYTSYYLYFRQRFPRRLLPYGVGQLILFIMLMAWPVSLGVMGFIYLTDCPMNEFMVFSLLLQSAMGITILGSRLTLVMHMIRTFPHRLAPDPLVIFMQKLVKWLEFLFLCYFIVQFACYYWQGYSTDPSSNYFCNPTLYNFIYGMNYFTFAMVVIWLNVYFFNWYSDSYCC